MKNDLLHRNLGMRIKSLRKKSGFSQEELSERINRSVDTISNIERGATLTKLDTANQIAEVFGLSLAELFQFTELEGLARQQQELIREIVDLLRQQTPSTIIAVRDQAKILIEQLDKNRS